MTRTIAIVGGGVAGLSTAWHLARRGGARVVLLEREPELGTHSSSRNAAILRTAAGDPVEVELAARGARFLRRPPAGFAEHPLVHPCGLILVTGPQREAELERWIALLPPDTAVRELDAAELARRAPYFRAGAGRAWLFPEEGRLDVRALLRAWAAGAVRAGAELRTGAPVAGLVRSGGAVRGVRLADGSALAADTVVVAAGGWAERLGREAGSRLALRPTRRHLLVTAPGPGVDEGWPVVWSLDEAFYARPEAGGLLLCACDETEVDPEAADAGPEGAETPDPAVADAIDAKARRLVPARAELSRARFWCGLRTFTADGRFAVGDDPDVPGLFWVAGLGGAGMVTSPEVGRLAAARLAGEELDEPLARALDPARLVRPAGGERPGPQGSSRSRSDASSPP